MFAALGQVLPSDSGEDQGGPALHEEGVLEALAKEAGLVPREGGYLEVVEEYPDLETLLRGYLAHGSVVRTLRSSDEPRVRDALSDGVRPLITAAAACESRTSTATSLRGPDPVPVPASASAS